MSGNRKNINVKAMTYLQLQEAFNNELITIKGIIDSFGSYNYNSATRQYKLTDNAYKRVSDSWIFMKNVLDTMRKLGNDLSRVDKYKLTTADNKSANAELQINKNNETINKNEKLLSSREEQYQLALERNAHRRKMVIMLAILNTLFLLIYYFVTK